MTPIEQVLDLARWAPSGDNTQPWRFEITGDRSCIIHTFDTRRHCVYDLTGGPSQIAVGALLETARIAATTLKTRALIERLPTDTDEQLQFQLELRDDGSIPVDDLAAVIRTRCTNRRAYSTRALSEREQSTLASSVGDTLRVRWFEGPAKSAVASLMFKSAKIRLTIPEAYQVHKEVIEWHCSISERRIPDRAVGLDPAGLALMRWAMKSWPRARFLARYLGGTLLPRLQLELLPGRLCAVHALFLSQSPPTTIDEHLRIGAAVQRFWLTAARLDLQFQPEMTPLIFAEYSRRGLRFTTEQDALELAAEVEAQLRCLLKAGESGTPVWMCRLGRGPDPASRSHRRPLSELIHEAASEQRPSPRQA